jgi:hypothetical protein
VKPTPDERKYLLKRICSEFPHRCLKKYLCEAEKSRLMENMSVFDSVIYPIIRKPGLCQSEFPEKSRFIRHITAGIKKSPLELKID